MRCKYCNSEDLVKNGKVNGGKQRYLCKKCGKNQTDTPRRGTPLSIRIQALKLYKEGNGIRAIGRILGYSPNTIMLWIRHFGEDLAKWYDSKTLAETATEIPILEIDEMWHFTKKNSESFGSGLLIAESQNGLSPLKLALVVAKRYDDYG